MTFVQRLCMSKSRHISSISFFFLSKFLYIIANHIFALLYSILYKIQNDFTIKMLFFIIKHLVKQTRITSYNNPINFIPCFKNINANKINVIPRVRIM